ncbi:uncharacterized protein LOC116928110 isoform X2 [Daphnia magna]|uniref:uncharacterized protein LOC116928110 isoform X2 n=1 Tax=Daphnia magna TaxID=35525 RepID=UPI001E1BB95F|nr:uncharacterized protein LOC116928110 isoform X2 [Daphnia magna]
MNSLIILISVVVMVASAPTETKDTVINVDGPEGRHVQTGEPGKAVAGYFTSRNTDGVEYKTTYEADEKGFRARGLHFPVSPSVSSARLPVTFPVRYPSPAFSGYGFRYGPQNHLPFFYPTYPQDKYLAADETLPYHEFAYKHDAEFPLSEEEEFALAQDDQAPLTEQEIADLTERGMLTPMLMPFILMNKKNMLMLMLVNKILMAMG